MHIASTNVSMGHCEDSMMQPRGSLFTHQSRLRAGFFSWAAMPWLLLVAACVAAQTLPKARSDSNALARAVLPMAQELLRTRGEFTPFGAGMTLTGEVVELPGPEQEDQPAPRSGTALRENLAAKLKSGNLLATAFIYEARVTTKPPQAAADAIAISIIHRQGYSAIFVFPYRYIGAQLSLGDPQIIEAQGGRRAIGQSP
jgi:hypothetical protein